jgi:HD superfamily phosphohydrolase YqeK
MTELHPLVRAAGEGRLPEWARAGESRRAHMARVAELMDAWARRAGKGEDEAVRWRAAAWLHDALRDEEEAKLRPWAAQGYPALGDLPELLLHGPAVAFRLREEGVRDGELLDALAFHTVGHPELGELGRALYVADFLDPERPFRREWREELGTRMPAELDAVTLEVLGARIVHLVEARHPIRPETAAFWNSMPGERL